MEVDQLNVGLELANRIGKIGPGLMDVVVLSRNSKFKYFNGSKFHFDMIVNNKAVRYELVSFIATANSEFSCNVKVNDSAYQVVDHRTTLLTLDTFLALSRSSVLMVFKLVIASSPTASNLQLLHLQRQTSPRSSSTIRDVSAHCHNLQPNVGVVSLICSSKSVQRFVSPKLASLSNIILSYCRCFTRYRWGGGRCSPCDCCVCPNNPNEASVASVRWPDLGNAQGGDAKKEENSALCRSNNDLQWAGGRVHGTAVHMVQPWKSSIYDLCNMHHPKTVEKRET